ncbi:MAG: hypothetical protein RIR39_1856 [Pseudomonadota bacterium]
MSLKTAICPRKTRKALKFSKKYYDVDRYPKCEWSMQCNILIYFVSFVDKMVFP